MIEQWTVLEAIRDYVRRNLGEPWADHIWGILESEADVKEGSRGS